MEQSKEMGIIQIALFSILKNIRAIIWQFMAAILAFSIAITKVYMAEESFLANGSDGNDKWVYIYKVIIILYILSCYTLLYFQNTLSIFDLIKPYLGLKWPSATCTHYLYVLVITDGDIFAT